MKKITNENLKERLKYWWVHCLNCGSFITKYGKQESVEEKLRCTDCNNYIDVYINLEKSISIFKEPHKQLVVIGCKFNFEV